MEPNKNISYFSFIEYINNTLSFYLNMQNKRVLKEFSFDTHNFDFYLPDGIDYNNQPTVIEVKRNTYNIEKFFQINEFLRINDLKLIIIVLDIEKGSNINKKALNTNSNYEIWSFEDYEKRIGDVIQFKNHSNIFEIAKKSSFFKTDSESLIINNVDLQIEQLKNKYNKGELALVLGAGVSVDAKIPAWDEFIDKLFIKILINEMSPKKNKEYTGTINFIKNEITKKNNVLTTLRYIKQFISYEEYLNLVHQVIYENDPSSETPLISSIIELCKSKNSKSLVKNIITFNFDDLIENQLRKKKIKHNIISCIEDSYEQDNLNVYHVHGYLPKNKNNFIEKSIELVFSEEDYHRVYGNPYCLSNFVQLNSLWSNTCLFIGCSLNDPNLRRLLDTEILKINNHRHFAILKREKLNVNYDEMINNEIIDNFNNLDLFIKNKLFDSLGIEIIWIDDYSEIPIILSKIRSF